MAIAGATPYLFARRVAESNFSPWTAMGLGVKLDPRMRFIVIHGVMPWGIIAGTLAALGGALAVRHEPMPAAPVGTATIIGVATLCFLIWCLFAGWIVGAIRWELRQMKNEEPGLPRNHERRPR